MDSERTPYPGLRSFRRDESDLFFGREGHVDDLVDRLARTHFLAVLGASGSGKSSLVRTGLLDGLELGLLAEAGSDWQIVDIHPGAAPIENLARGLLESTRDAASIEDADVQTLASFLSRGPLAVAEWCEDGHLREGANLLLLVDQFEELFRYDSYETREKAQALTSLLIQSARQRRCPIYVIVTMRSEYLGACALIDGLAEAINRGQYLTPRMTRDQCQAAIVGPAGVCGFEIEPALVNRMLNDLASFAPWEESGVARAPASDSASRETPGSISQLDRLARRADQLPLMQHVLNRLWTKARSSGSPGGRIVLRLSDYDGLEQSLSVHADEVLKGLVDRQGEAIIAVAEKVFRALVSGNSIAEAVRRPTPFGELVAVEGGDDAAVRAVVDAFRAAGCSFLLPGPEQPLFVATRIDISHESLIRQWPQLSRWVEKEASAAVSWRRLDEAARRHNSGQGSLFKGLDLSNVLKAHEEWPPTAAWSERYGNNFGPAMAFLLESQKAEAAEAAEHDQLRRQAEREAEAAELSRRRVRWFQRLAGATLAAAVISVVMLAGSIYVLMTSREEARASKQEAEARLATATREAEQQRREASEQLARAGTQLEQANRQAGIAQAQIAEAERQVVALAAHKIAQWQNEGRWDIAGGFFAALADRLPRSADGVPQYPVPLAAELRRPAQLQALGELALRPRGDNVGAGDGSSRLDLDGPLSNIVVATFVEPSNKNLKIAVAGRSPDKTQLFLFTGSSDKPESWQREPPITIGPQTVGATGRGPGRIRAIAFSDDGSHIAILFDERIYIGTPSDLRAQRATEYVPLPPGASESHSAAETEIGGSAAPARVRDTALSSISTCSGAIPTFITVDGLGNVTKLAVTTPGSADGAKRPELKAARLQVPDAVKADRQTWFNTPPRLSYTRNSDQFILVGGGRHILKASCTTDEALERIRTVAQDTIRVASFVGPNRIAAATSNAIHYLTRNGDGSWSTEPHVIQLPAGMQVAHMTYEDHAWVATAGTVHEIWQLQPPGSEGPRAATTVRLTAGKPSEVYPVGDLPLLLAVADDSVLAQPATASEQGSPARIALHSKLRSWLPADTAEREFADTLQILTAAGLIKPRTEPKAPAVAPACGDQVQYLVDLLERLTPDDPGSTATTIQSGLEEIARCAPAAAGGPREYLRAALVSMLGGMMSMTDIRGRARRGDLLKLALVAASQGDPVALRLTALLVEPPNPQADGPVQTLRTGLQVLATTRDAPVPTPLVGTALRSNDTALARRLLAAEPLKDGRYFEIRAHSETEARAQILSLAIAERLYAAVGDSDSARRVGEKRARKALSVPDDDLDWISRELERVPMIDMVAGVRQPTPGFAADKVDIADINAAFDRLAQKLFADTSTSPLAGAALLLVEDSVIAPIGRPRPEGLEGYRLMLDRLPSVSNEEALSAAYAARRIGDRLAAGAQTDDASRAYMQALALLDRGSAPPVRGTDWIASAAAILLDGDRFLATGSLEALGTTDLTWNFLQIINWNSIPTDAEELRKFKALLIGATAVQDRIVARGGDAAKPSPAVTAALLGKVYAQFNLAVLADRDKKPADRNTFLAASLAAYRQMPKDFEYLARHRVQIARTLEWSAAAISRSSYPQRIAAWSEARTFQLDLLKSVVRGRDDDYLVAAVLSRTSYVLTYLAEDLTISAAQEFQAGRREEGVRDALRALTVRFEQQAILKKNAYGGLVENNERSTDFAYLEPTRGTPFADTVGLVAGLRNIDPGERSTATRCEQLAAYAYDPMRRAYGTLEIPTAPDAVSAARTACRTAQQAKPADPRLNVALGRLLTTERFGKDRDEMLRLLLDAGSSGSAAAYQILSGVLPTQCSALRDRMQRLYVTLVLKDYANVAAAVLTEMEPEQADDKISDWLKDEASSARKQATAQLEEVANVDLASLKTTCKLQ